MPNWQSFECSHLSHTFGYGLCKRSKVLDGDIVLTSDLADLPESPLKHHEIGFMLIVRGTKGNGVVRDVVTTLPGFRAVLESVVALAFKDSNLLLERIDLGQRFGEQGPSNAFAEVRTRDGRRFDRLVDVHGEMAFGLRLGLGSHSGPRDGLRSGLAPDLLLDGAQVGLNLGRRSSARYSDLHFRQLRVGSQRLLSHLNDGSFDFEEPQTFDDRATRAASTVASTRVMHEQIAQRLVRHARIGLQIMVLRARSGKRCFRRRSQMSERDNDAHAATHAKTFDRRLKDGLQVQDLYGLGLKQINQCSVSAQDGCSRSGKTHASALLRHGENDFALRG